MAIIAILITSFSVKADWVQYGASVQCDSKRGIFTVAPLVETSSKEYDVLLEKGFTKLEIGENQNIKCKLDSLVIKMAIDIYGPQARGMGQAGGVLRINKLAANTENLIGAPTNFNWRSSSERVLTIIRIKKYAFSGKLELCTTLGWDWDFPYENMVCKTEPFDFKG